MESGKDEKIGFRSVGVDQPILGLKVHPSHKSVPRGSRAAKKGERILEVGVGPGLALAFCPPECCIVGIDVSAGQLKKARKRAKLYGLHHIELLHMDAAHMDFEDDSFDTVMAANLDMSRTDYRKAVMEMIRVCRPGGRIIMLSHIQHGSDMIPISDKGVVSIDLDKESWG